MEGKITDNGELSILRRGQWREIYCPHSQMEKRCGDMCPFFNDMFQRNRYDEEVIKVFFNCVSINKYLIVKRDNDFRIKEVRVSKQTEVLGKEDEPLS